jgi:hypothetical protein
MANSSTLWSELVPVTLWNEHKYGEPYLLKEDNNSAHDDC